MLRLLPFLALGFLVAGCDSDGVDPPARTVLDVTVAPTGTYLRTNSDPGATNATVVALADLEAAGGDEIAFGISGTIVVDPVTVFGSRDILGVFSRSSVLDASDQPARVPGALAVNRGYTSFPTSIGGLTTDIQQDFRINGGTVTVPAGATHLFLTVSDGYYSDNVAGPQPMVVRLVKL
jgi:hypothetical protein